MENEISTWVAIVTSILTLVVGGGWFQEYQKGKKAKREANERLVVDYLRPIITLLKVNEGIHGELYQNNLEQGWGILESYLIKIRRDGIKPHALMRERIHTAVQNNDTIVTLLNKYAAYTIITPELRSETERFRDHAIRYSNRWKALFEVYETKAELPVAAPFPKGFPKAVEGEVSARLLPTGAYNAKQPTAN